MEKKNDLSVVLSAIIIVFSAVLAAGSKTVFHACPVNMGHGAKMSDIMPCHWAEQAVFATGIVLVVIGVLHFIFSAAAQRAALSAAMIPVTIMVLLFPQVIIRLCMKPEMMCRTAMRPAVTGIAIVLIILEVLSVAVNLKKSKVA